MNERIQIRFFIEYGAGCLWSGNEAARNKFGVGCLNATIYALNGKVAQEPAIKLPADIELKNDELIELYQQSFNHENPGGESLWNESQWTSFLMETESLFHQVAEFLGPEIELINEQKTGYNKT